MSFKDFIEVEKFVDEVFIFLKGGKFVFVEYRVFYLEIFVVLFIFIFIVIKIVIGFFIVVGKEVNEVVLSVEIFVFNVSVIFLFIGFEVLKVLVDVYVKGLVDKKFFVCWIWIF